MSVPGTTTVTHVTARLPRWLRERCGLFHLRSVGVGDALPTSTLYHVESQTIVMTNPSPRQTGLFVFISRPTMFATVGFGSPWQRPRVERRHDRTAYHAGWFGLVVLNLAVPMYDALNSQIRATTAEILLRMTAMQRRQEETKETQRRESGGTSQPPWQQ